MKAAKLLGKASVRQGFFGQEINITTYNLCRINMFLHDIDYDKFDIAHGDTLTDPRHWDDEPFEAIVSNPPYSIHWEGDANPLLINDPRFSPAGVLAPKSKADLAFIMHSLSWLAAIVAAYAGREDRAYFTRLVPNGEIAEQDYNLSVATYVEREDTREKVDIVRLNAEIAKIVAREQVLRDEIDRLIAEIEVGA